MIVKHISSSPELISLKCEISSGLLLIENAKLESKEPEKRFARQGMPQEQLDFYLNLYANHLKETPICKDNFDYKKY